MRSLGAPSPRAWARISAAMAAEPRRPPASARFASSLTRLLELGAEARPTRLAWIAATAALVIVAEGGALLALAPWRGDAVYQAATAKPGEGAEVLIAFAPDVRISDISAFLQERHGSIDEGPRGDMYRVRFGDKRLSAEETDALVKDLRAVPIVRLALPGGN